VNIQAADINGDHLPELIVANAGDANSLGANPDGQALWYGNSIGVLANLSSTGSVSFGITSTINSNLEGPFAVAVADYNLDGNQDIAAVNYGAGSDNANTFVSVFTGDGQGNFATTTPGRIDTLFNSPGGQYLAAGDFDHNGSPDLIIASASNQVGLLTNNTPAGTAPTVSSVQVNNGNAQRSEVKSIQVTFSGPVTFSGGNATAAFQLTHVQDGVNVALFAAVSTNGSNQTVVTLTFSGSETDPVSALNGGPASLADGRYQLTIFSANVSGAGGVALAGGGTNGNYVSPADTFGGSGLHLYRLFGDANGDGVIDTTDLSFFRSAFNSNSSQASYVSWLDADNSGAIDNNDLGQFRTRYNLNVF
jgi:hypothetical protein